MCALYYAIVLYNVALTERTVPTLREGLEKRAPDPRATHWPSITVVIPAHNEQDVIGRLAGSIRDHVYDGELHAVFVLDRCTDDTERVLAEQIGDDDRFEVIINEACPGDWSGKTHAVWRGVQESAGARDADLLLFTDADCWLEPGCLTAAVRLLARRRLGMLSLLPSLTTAQPFERVEQPAAGLELVRQFPLTRVNRRDRPRRFANGQFMLFTRAAYDLLGGHEAVKDAVLEDLAFARLARRVGPVHVGVFMAAGLFRCSMYRSPAEFRRGWKRIFQEAAYCRPSVLRRNAARLRLVGMALPALAVTCLSASAVPLLLTDQRLALAMAILGGAGLFTFAYALWRIYRTQGVPARAVLVYPLGAARVASVLAEGAHDIEQGRATEWAGMTYDRRAGHPEGAHDVPRAETVPTREPTS